MGPRPVKQRGPLRLWEHQLDVGPAENTLKIKAINLVVFKPFFGRQGVVVVF